MEKLATGFFPWNLVLVSVRVSTWKYQPIWVLVSVSDLNQDIGFGRTLISTSRGRLCPLHYYLSPSPPIFKLFHKKAFAHPWRLKAFFVLFNFFLPPPKAVWSSVLQWWFGKARTLSFLLHTRQFFACGRTQGQISREASLKLQVGPLFHTGANIFLKPILKYKM